MRLREVKKPSEENEVEDVENIPCNGITPKKEQITEEMEVTNVSQLQGDYLNVALLLFLYVLQGIPLGMAASIPMILQNKNVSYKQQAMFSFVYWPFSMKLLWAPIVDAAYFRRFGRRKTWLVPVQYLIGMSMLLMSMKVDVLLEGETPKVLFLTIIFFSLNFLAATQDIAVDGWALTMLKKQNVGYASTCNSVGQTAGYFFGNVVLLAFSSPEFCNKYIRSVPQDVGVVTVAGFLFFCSIVFLVTTTLLWMFKREKDIKEGHDHGIAATYFMLIKIAKLPAVQELVVVLLTVKIGFAAADAVTGLKLIEAGVKKETLALMAVPLVPLQILLPIIISRFTTGPKPLDVYMKAIPLRLLFGLIFALLVYWTQFVRPEGVEEFPYYYYATILTLYALHQVTLYSMFVSIMAFFAKVSDPAIGGTYMTLLNTLSNLGGNWPATLMLWFVDPLTSKECTLASNSCNDLEQSKVTLYSMFVSIMAFFAKVSDPAIGGTYMTLLNTLTNLGGRWPATLMLWFVDPLTAKECTVASNSCNDLEQSKLCVAAGGRCNTLIDGYYIESVLCVALGFLWLVWKRRSLNHLQNRKETDWKVS